MKKAISILLVVVLLCLVIGCNSSAPTLKSISITVNPTKQSYVVGEKLDLTGMVVTAYYSDGKSNTVAKGQYTTDPAEGTELMEVGTKVITVTYEGKTTEYAVSVVSEDPAELTLISLIASLDKQKREDINSVSRVSDFEKEKASIAKRIEKYQYILTQEEVDSLFVKKELKTNLTMEEAIEDVNLLFRLIKYRYSNYYYELYGGDSAFEAAEQKILKELSDKDSVTVSELLDLLFKNLSFIEDAHIRFNDCSILEMNPDVMDKVRYWYSYSDEVFERDSDGYYQVIEGTKYYYESCTGEGIKIAPSSAADGVLTYSLIRFCPTAKDHSSDTVSLKSKNITKTKTIIWKKANPRDYPTVFKCYTSNDISYIHIPQFMLTDSELSEFLESAEKCKNSKAVILDIRHNGGGNSNCFDEWVKKLCGSYIEHGGEYRVGVKDATNSDLKVAEGIQIDDRMTFYSQGKMIGNKTMLIILQDMMSGSGSDFVAFESKYIQNTLRIGSNSRGACYGGIDDWFEGDKNSQALYLPNSGIKSWIGTGTVRSKWLGNEVLTENIGVIPDIWTNPEYALDTTLKLLVSEEIVDQKAVDDFRKEISYQ